MHAGTPRTDFGIFVSSFAKYHDLLFTVTLYTLQADKNVVYGESVSSGRRCSTTFLLVLFLVVVIGSILILGAALFGIFYAVDCSRGLSRTVCSSDD